MVRSSYRQWFAIVGTILLGLMTLGILFLPRTVVATATDPITTAWAAARAAGSYHFTSDVTQVTLPLATVSNVGRSSRTEQFYLEGESDLNAKMMELTLWSDTGSTAQANSGLSIRSEKGKTFARRGEDDWQSIDDVTSSFAPQGDFLSYLSAIKDVTAQPTEQRNGIQFTRYAFTIDSPRFALHMHKQMEATLRARGELPPSIHLSAPAYFHDMVGSGELWVGKDGLPLRQILTLQFPAQNDEQTNLQLVVDFSKFGVDKSTVSGQEPGTSSWLGIGSPFTSALPALPVFTLFLAFFTLSILLVYYRRAHRVQVAVVILVIFAQLAGPLLSTITNVRYFDAQAAKAATQEEHQAEAKSERQMSEALGKVAFNPHLNPLEKAGQEDKEIGRWGDEEMVVQSPMLSIPQSPVLQTSDTGLDTDGDGLTDFAETRIGTDIAFTDSDEDTLSDKFEVGPFILPTDPTQQRWYANPLEADTNSDSLPDTLELDSNGDLIADDTDNDRVPDFFDTDNDNDGVPDSLDSAPNSIVQRTGGFDEANPLQLKLQNLNAGKPTFVDFQIRPLQTNHLWFAFNLLDWPQDSQGQMRDVDNKSYADLAQANGAPAANSTAGDMKLVPMLELRIPTASANLPANSDLTSYNISVNNLTADGSTKVAYVPLSLLTDQQTGQRVAFTGRMRYLPGAAWSQAHQVRLVWLVQALVDVPCDPQAADAEPGCAADSYIHNVPQVIRSYYDTFSLSGLNVREDHGAGTAIIYEDPAVDNNLKDDTALVALSHGLDNSFLAPRDQNNDGRRDVTLPEIARRFDRDSNSSVSATERWGIANTLQVERSDYATSDYAAVSLAMTETTRILNNRFANAWATDKTLKPLLMFAQEESYRGLGLDGLRTTGNYLSFSGTTLTVDMAPSGQPATALDTLASVKWMPYCAADAPTPRWTPCELDTYWTELEQRYGLDTALPDYPNDPDVIAGNMAVLQLYFLALIQGTTRAILRNNALVSSLYTLKSDSQLDGYLRTGTGLGNTVVKTLTNKFVTARYVDKVSILKYLGRQFREFRGSTLAPLVQSLRDGPISILRAFFSGGNINRLVGTGIILGVTVVLAGLVTGVYFLVDSYLSTDPARILGAKIAIKVLMISLITFLSVISPIKTAIAWVDAVKIAGNSTSILRSGSQVLGSTRAAAVVGLVIGVAITWGFFIYSMVSNHVTAFSPTFNRALAETIASTIYLVLLFVLSLTVIGTILVAIVAAIDAILTAICELGVDELRTVPGLGGACFTLGTSAVKILAYSIYNYDLMINTERSDLMITGSPQVTLADKALGYAEGNILSVTLPVTTTAVHKDPDPANGLLIYPYLWLYSEDSLKSSTFKYSLDKVSNITPTVALNDMTTAWQNVGEDHKFVLTPMYKGTASTTPAPLGGYPLSAGLNQPIPFTLNMGFAVPAYECWGVLVLGVCYRREYIGGNHMPINSLVYDVYPATFDGFMRLINSGDGGLRIDWDAAFTTLRDADGDGLFSPAFNGLDPNDASVDADNDGLTDRYELEKRQSGVALSPISRDSDNDGLTDLQEMQLGSNPGISDSDNDGLKDGEEVYHQRYDAITGAPTAIWEGGWDVTINAATPFTIRVSSDPFRADSDGDGASDQTERQLALDASPANRLDNQNRPYHPRVPNTAPLAVFVEINDADGFVTPGQTLRYTSTVIASVPVAAGVLNVSKPSELEGAIAPMTLPFNPLIFSGAQTMTRAINLAVAGITPQVRISSTASTRLKDTGSSSWSFAPINLEAPLGNYVAPTVANFSAVTASRRDRQDNYLLSALAINDIGLNGAGDILAYALPGGSLRAIENDNNNQNAFMHDAAPSMATNTFGDTLAAWGQLRICNTVTFNSLKVVTAGADSGTSGIEPFIAFKPATGAEQQIWYWTAGTGGSNDVTSGRQFGPNAGGFPITRTFCSGQGVVSVYESDGPVNDPTKNTLVRFGFVSVYDTFNGVISFTGDGHTIEVNVTVPALDEYVVAGALLGADGQIKRSITFPVSPLPTNFIRQSLAPVVASDGNSFLVAYESAPQEINGVMGSPEIVVQAFDRDGNPQSNTRIGSGGGTSVSHVNNIALDMAWTGSSYRLLWQDRRDTTVWSTAAAANGQSMTAASVVASNALANAGASYRPSLAYDPISGRTLMVYLDATNRIMGQIYQGATVVKPAFVINSNAAAPKVVWHPGYKGWLVSYKNTVTPDTTLFIPLDANGAVPFPAAFATSVAMNDNSLACPAAQSYPQLDLRFEELPQSILFPDVSGYNNNATCTGTACPATGYAGAPNAPLSDYAAQFDGIDDRLTVNTALAGSFTAAMWVKAAPGTNNDSVLVDQGANLANGWVFSLGAGIIRLQIGTNQLLAPAGPRIDDNQWHFVLATRDGPTGNVALYVDGALTAANGFANSTLNATANLLIGGDRSGLRSFKGQMDHLQIIPASFGPEAVKALYDRTRQSYCVAAGTSGNKVYWSKVQASQPDVRGGRISASNGLTLTIDSDLPTSQISSVRSNDFVAPGLVLGGTASDLASGVSRVEVSVNNGAWLPAAGANTWSFSLAGYSGAISLRTRAIDNVGYVGNPSPAINVTIDNTAPVLSIDLPQVPAFIPGINANGRWQVPIYGGVRDSAGIKPESLLVYLQQQSGVGAAQTTQRATIVSSSADGTSSWVSNYTFDAAFADPTGAYTVTVQATDKVGNVSSATQTLRLDITGPAVALSSIDTSRTVISQTLPIGGVVNDKNSIVGVDKVEIAFTPIEQVLRLPGGAFFHLVEPLLNRPWYPATVAQAGAPISNWSLQIPSGLEGVYQMDARATDKLGNVLVAPNLWRGTIDTVAPRLTMLGRVTGNSVFDAPTNTRYYEINYSCRAEDWQLSTKSFTCPYAYTTQTFYVNDILQSTFPSLTLVSTLSNTWTEWYPVGIPPGGTLSACDGTGLCASTNVQVISATVAAAGSSSALDLVSAAAASDALGLNAAIVNPTDHSFVASTGMVEVTVAAEADKTLREVTVYLDGEVVATLPFARIDKLTAAKQTFSLPMSPGKHTLEARASDWAGNVQASSSTSAITVIAKQLTVALSKDRLTISDTWAAQSGVMVIRGSVDKSDENLSAIQVKVGDQEYMDAQFANGVWGVAYPVIDPENRTLAITVRAIDKAGQITILGDGVTSNLNIGQAPETKILNAPAAISNSTDVTFSFEGDANAAVFECQLDDATFVPCSSPASYADLSNGSHTFRVHAINGQGTQDPTPAEFKWTVQGQGQLVAISEAPANPSHSRTASFEFELAGTDDLEADFECSLDGSGFTPCREPQDYSSLSDGNHSFQVRVKGNPASKHVWRITNGAPVVVSQIMTTAQNTNLSVTLQANDEDGLTYQIINKPANGVLQGTAPNLVYQPGTDFFGVDSFTFKADDGDASSNLATVTIHVTPTPGQGGLQRDGFVVFGQEGVILRENVKVMSGDIAASLTSQGPWLGDGAEVSIGAGVTFADAKSKVMGDSLFIGAGSALGDANFNELRGPGTVKGTKVTPQALPLLTRFVSLPAIGVGKQHVEVAANGKLTLAPGSYLSLKVGKGGEVTFSGGVYSFKEWNVGDNSKLTFAGASEIRIAGRALVGMNSYVGPAASSAVTAKQIVIFVAGVNANSAVLGGLGIKSATFGPYATLAANVVVPNGTLLIRERSKAVGSFVGRWVSVGKFSELTLANRFNSNAVDGRVSDYVSLTLDDVAGINATAPLSADVNDELLSEEGSNDEIPNATQPSKIYLPVISSGTVDSEAVDSESVSGLQSPVSDDAQNNVVFLPTVSR